MQREQCADCHDNRHRTGDPDCTARQSDLRCNACGRVGHVVANCPDGETRSCFKCGQCGHLKRNCRAGNVANSRRESSATEERPAAEVASSSAIAAAEELPTRAVATAEEDGANTSAAAGTASTSTTAPAATRDAEAEFYAILQCRSCLGLAAPPLFQCNNGHLICNECRGKLEACPVCKVPLETHSVRIRILEDLVENRRFRCEYADDGCEVSTRLADRAAHEESCGFRRHRCPVQEIPCGWHGTSSDLGGHLEEIHAARQIQAEEVIQLGPAVYVEPHFLRYWYWRSDHRVFLVSAARGFQWGCVVVVATLVGSSREAQEWQARVVFAGAGQHLELRSPVLATEDAVLDQVEHGHGLAIRLATLNLLMADDSVGFQVFVTRNTQQ